MAGTVKVDTVQSSASNTPPFFKDSAGTEMGQLCRAWVKFQAGNGNTAGVVNASFNVSSVTVNGTGDFTINFTNALPDAHYTAVGSISKSLTGADTNGMTIGTQATNTCRVFTVNTASGGGSACTSGFVSIFR